MWLIPLLAASIAATAAYTAEREYSKYLVLILWSATLMVFVDWLWSYVEEGTFIPQEVLEDPVGSSILGLVMTIAAIPLWLAAVVIARRMGRSK